MNNNISKVKITASNNALNNMKLSWRTAEYSAIDGIGSMGSLYEAGDSLVALGYFEEDKLILLGSGVMVAPGMFLTATHVLDEFSDKGYFPVCLTFLKGATRAWFIYDVETFSCPSIFHADRQIKTDISLVSCTLNSEAHEDQPLMLTPIQVALPLIGERLWAMGFRYQGSNEKAALITPFISSGLVMSVFPNGRGERLISPCFEVDMVTLGGMSGGPVVNDKGYLIGIISSSLEGGPSYITLIWDAIRMTVKSPVEKMKINEKISLLGAKAQGLSKIKGTVKKDPFNNFTLGFSGKEMTLLIKSLTEQEQEKIKPMALNSEQLEEFQEQWGYNLEEISLKKVLCFLNSLPLSTICETLQDSNLSNDLLSKIEEFSVEDLDGIEDFAITFTEKINDVSFRVYFYIEIPNLIWTIKTNIDFEKVTKKSLSDWNITDGVAKMEMIEKRYFQGYTVFHHDTKTFAETTITHTSIKTK
ncbi:trypsin-like peptidase [Zymomonas mobilis]|uniref:Trypsin-like peptidase n=1 Tax=Zymomonas mobilis TaxID=542 RepID=A0A542VUL7_ZYMMB|nr:serine protease [Zymomonas mobilis]TQL15020.1 trypsin-like peptidase [Zymomonas mobilis]